MRTRPPAILLAATTLALALPHAAGASTIEITASAGPSANEYMEYRTTKGEDNRVAINITRNSLVLVDRGTRRITVKNSPFGRCRATSRRRVVCPRFPLFALLRDGDDRFTAAPGAHGNTPTSTDPFDYAAQYEDTEGAVVITTYVDGGSGDDFISGTNGDDVLVPGSGRDRVEGRGGPDDIVLAPDGVTDKVLGNGGVDAVRFDTDTPVSVDLAARTGGPLGDPDSITSTVERVHGGRGDDTLRGRDGIDALYGEGGSDAVDGRGGADYLHGDSPVVSENPANALVGGSGDDVLDTRVYQPTTAVTTVDCGDGSDRHLGGVEARLDRSCELAILRMPFLLSGNPFPADDEEELTTDPMKAFPVAKTADSVTFEAVCPRSRRDHTGCSGTITLERPRAQGSDAPGQQYGSATFTLSTGQRGNVTVPLDGPGRAAVAGDGPVAVRVEGEFTVQNVPPGGAGRFRAGWQADL